MVDVLHDSLLKLNEFRRGEGVGAADDWAREREREKRETERRVERKERDDAARKGRDRRKERTRDDIDARRELSHELNVHLSEADTV